MRENSVNQTPVRLLIILMVSIFSTEAIIMSCLHVLGVPLWIEAMMDSFLLTIVMFPVLYFFVFRPLNQYVSRIKRADEELKVSEEQYKDLFENMNDMVQVVSPDGSYKYVNLAWSRALGYSTEDVKKLTITDVIHPDSMAHCMKLFQCLMAGEEIGRCETVFRSKDGRAIMVEGSINCKFENGMPVYTRGIFRDITESKRAEDDLKRVHGELQEKSKYLERLNRQMVGRETRVLEMKKEVNDLLERLGEAKRYEWTAEQIKEKA